MFNAEGRTRTCEPEGPDLQSGAIAAMRPQPDLLPNSLHRGSYVSLHLTNLSSGFVSMGPERFELPTRATSQRRSTAELQPLVFTASGDLTLCQVYVVELLTSLPFAVAGLGFRQQKRRPLLRPPR